MLSKAEVVARYLPETLQVKPSARNFAPSNIALCKYWGKRDNALNLPVNSSLSISLGHLGTHTRLALSDSGEDKVLLNGKEQALDSPFAAKAIAFWDLFRRDQILPIEINTTNNIPTAAGLASSASGFAALTKAINEFANLNLPIDVLSAFARMGSGSACRSLFDGFVEWEMGQLEDGMDSHGIALEASWPDLRVGLVKVETGEKAVDSRSGMKRTVETAHLYQSWPMQAAMDIQKLRQAIADKDIDALGMTAEHNAMSMHATMIASWPPLLYWQPASVAVMQDVWALREQGVSVYLTMDAGPNMKLLFEADQETAIEAVFNDMEVVAPFAS